MVIKKLIAISVVFALVAGAAFAVDLGGEVIGSVNIAEKSSGSDAELFKGDLGRIRLEGSGDAEIGIGSIGGWVRFERTNNEVGPVNPWESPANVVTAFGLAWWQPIEALRIQLGVNPDGHYDTSHIGRYGFYAQANEIGLVNSDGNWGGTSWDSAVFGGYGNLHFGLIITPMDGLSVNVAIPLNADPGTTGDSAAAATFKGALFQVNYAAGFGTIHFTYAGAGSSLTDLGKIYASANLTMIENLGIEFGVGFGLGKAGNKPPLGIGLAATYGVGSFSVKLRSIFELAMASGAPQKVTIRVDLLPSFAVNDSVSIFLDAGIVIPAKSTFGYHVAPYVRVGSEWGPGFYAGLKFSGQSASGASTTTIAIPVGIIAKF